MNTSFKKINIEDVLFFDIECVRKNKELDENSKEFELYRKKIRDRNTDELPTIEHTKDHYRKQGALRFGYNKIVTIGVGYVRAGEVYIKALVGTEEEILKQFFNITKTFKYISGFNIMYFDIPLCILNASQYFDVTEYLPECFNTVLKKSWNLDKIIDLIDVKGTHYANMSLDEMLYHFGLDSSKTDIDGSQVSEAWYQGHEEKVIEYVKQDVFQTVNLFSKMQFKQAYEDYIDRSGTETKKAPSNPLEDLYKSDYLSDKIKAELKEILEKKKMLKKDKVFLQDLLENVYIRSEFMDTDKPDVAEAKKSEIAEFLKTLK